MAQIGTLGDIAFTVSQNTVKTFKDLQIQSQVNYAKHTRHNKKPLLEFQYKDTDTGSFTIYLSAFLKNFLVSFVLILFNVMFGKLNLSKRPSFNLSGSTKTDT